MKKYMYLVDTMLFVSYCFFNRLEIIINRTSKKAYFRFYLFGTFIKKGERNDEKRVNQSY